jgi:UDP-N-acetylmuramate dehydrogenase
MATMTELEFVREQVPLAERTWMKVGGTARFFAEPASVDELLAVVNRSREEGLSVRLLGGGSKVLVRDEGVDAMIIALTHPCFQSIEIKGRRAKVGGGAQLANAITLTVGAGLAGLESLVGIPGTVGGALHGNSGTHGGDIGQWTTRATVMTRGGEVIAREHNDLVFAYRQSSLDELVILSAEFELEEEDPNELTKRMQKQWIVKKANLPLVNENTGCIFKNPRGMSAGMLIDQSGLKGERVGNVEVSQRHANFFVAHPGATTREVLQLADVVRSRVAEKMGVELELEVEVW